MGLLWSEGPALVFTMVLAFIAAGLLLFIRQTQPDEWRRLKEQYRDARRGRLRRPGSSSARSTQLSEDEVFPRPYVPAPDVPPALRTASSVARGVLKVVRVLVALGMILLAVAAYLILTNLPGWS